MSLKATGPLFKCFGSKWTSARLLPKPTGEVIVEPFAGSAGYSLRHPHLDVVLYESSAHLRTLWKWIIEEASETDVRDIPLGLAPGTDIRTLGLSEGQALLLKNWQRTNNVGDLWKTSVWGHLPGQWTANTRARVSEEIAIVKHWKMSDEEDGISAFDLHKGRKFTFMIDPPYQYNFKYLSAAMDYPLLAYLAQGVEGQVLALEGACTKTGKVPDYLPFEYFTSQVTSRRKKFDNHHSSVLLYYKEQRRLQVPKPRGVS